MRGITGRPFTLICITAAMLALLAGCGGSKTATGTSTPAADNSGLYRIAQGGKYGYIDTTGKLVINPQFDNAGDFHNGLATIGLGGRYGYIDTTGKIAINPQFDYASNFSRGVRGHQRLRWRECSQHQHLRDQYTGAVCRNAYRPGPRLQSIRLCGQNR